MPNTSHRVLHTHPSQSMLNHLREPQKDVLSIQLDLDDQALFIDIRQGVDMGNFLASGASFGINYHRSQKY